MTSTPPDDVAALFDLPPLPASPQAAWSLEDAEAELAAELALTLDAGDIATDAPDSRTDPRVAVSWPARMRLSDGRVIALTVRNVSHGGVGLACAQELPARAVVDFEMDVPHPDAPGQTAPVRGAIETTYTVAQSDEVLCGGTWQAPPAGAELVARWIERLRG